MSSISSTSRTQHGGGLMPTPLQLHNRGTTDSSDSIRARQVLQEYDVKTNEMGEFPAKDIINALTKLAENFEVAPHIADFLQDKVRRVLPCRKLPLFYLMDSIMKNVGGQYVSLFGKSIVSLYQGCVTKVSKKDRLRFVHVLNTWEKQRMFPAKDIYVMRKAAEHAEAVIKRDVARGTNASRSRSRTPPPGSSEDTTLRRLLTKLQSEMGVHPNKHMSLEEVRNNNPDFYKSLLVYRAEQNGQAAIPKRPSPSKSRVLPPPRPAAPVVADPTAVLQILQNLKGLSKASSTPPAEVTAQKGRNEVHIQSLYAALPLVCRQSGLRFKKQEDLDAHLDFLFQYNRSQREKAKGGTSRSWYPDAEQWVTDFKALGEGSRGETSGSFFANEEESSLEAVKDDSATVLVDENITHCRICSEKFEKFFDEEEEEWMYKNAVIGQVHNATPGGSQKTSIFHKHCYIAATAKSNVLSLSQLAPGTPQSARKASWKSAANSTPDSDDVAEPNSDDTDDEKTPESLHSSDQSGSTGKRKISEASMSPVSSPSKRSKVEDQ